MEVILSWYRVRDLEKSKKFYAETLGLNKTFEMQGWAEFSHATGATAALVCAILRGLAPSFCSTRRP